MPGHSSLRRGAGALLCLLFVAGCSGSIATNAPTGVATPVITTPTPPASEPSATPTARPAPPFAVGQVIKVPPTPLVGGIAVADVDGDGKADLVTCNGSGTSVSVVPGNGDGTFGTIRAVDIGTPCTSVIAVDLNGDATLDLATANPDGSVSVLLGAAGGTFGAPKSYSIAGDLAPAPAWTIAAATLDGDTSPDLVATVFNFDLGFVAPGHLAVLLNTGDGTFKQPVFYPDRSAVAVVEADVNGDSKIDVVSGSGDSTARVFLGDGSGALGTPAEYGLVGAGVALSVVDLNGDGLLDFATGDDATNLVEVWLAKSDRTFAKGQQFPAGNTHTIAVVDLDGDGRLDLLAGAYTEPSVRVWMGLGDGTFSGEARIDTGAANIVAMTAHDFNGDGRPDLAFADGESAIHILLAQ